MMNFDGRRFSGRVRALLAVGAGILCVAVASCNDGNAVNGLGRFAKGEIADLEILSDPPAQPGIMFVDAEGERLTLEAFRGKVLVLNLWATWCVPCIQEMPALDRLAAARRSDQFEVVAVSFDRSMSDAREFYETTPITSLGLYQDSSTAMSSLLGVAGIPVTVIYDPEGNELARLSNGAEWDSPDALALIDAVIADSFPAEDAQG